MLNNEAAAYIAGLFDGEGCVSYKQYMRKRKGAKKAYPQWQIRLEIAMTDYSILVWVLETLGVGKVNSRKVQPGRKKQWRWRCTHRDAYYVCKVLWPYAHVKLDKIQQIIAHYSKQKLEENNVIDFQHYKMWIKGKK